MGKKNRKGSRRGDEEEGGDEHDEVLSSSPLKSSTKESNNKKSMDFAERRELQRQQAQEKRRSKMKCYLCGKAGHVRRECPGILDDGRGMSRFKSARFSDSKTAVSKQYETTTTKRKERSSSSGSYGTNEPSYVQVDYPPGFSSRMIEDSKPSSSNSANEELPLVDGDDRPTKVSPCYYHDTNCDIAAIVTYLQSGRGKKHRLSQTEALQELQHYLECASTKQESSLLLLRLGGMISNSWLRKHRPWTAPIPDNCFLQEERHCRLFYTVGLSPTDFVVLTTTTTVDDNDDADAAFILQQQQQQKEEAVTALVETNASHPSSIAGFHATLDYTEDGSLNKRKGFNKESQLARLQWTCLAAGQCNLAVQIQVQPGYTSAVEDATSGGRDDDGSSSSNSSSVAGTPYANALLDLQQVLSVCLQEFPALKIHLSSWNGSAAHMLAFSKAFPTMIFGLDSSVTFHKATHLHECAFELDFSATATTTVLPRVVLETNNSIPSAVANGMGRDAFSQPGWIPFIASAIAKYNPFRVETSSGQEKNEEEIEEVDFAAIEIAKRTALAAEALYPLLKTVGDSELDCG